MKIENSDDSISFFHFFFLFSNDKKKKIKCNDFKYSETTVNSTRCIMICINQY